MLYYSIKNSHCKKDNIFSWLTSTCLFGALLIMFWLDCSNVFWVSIYEQVPRYAACYIQKHGIALTH